MSDAPPAHENRVAAAEAFDAHSYLEANATAAPDSVAVWQNGEETTFAQLRELVAGFMYELRRRSIGDGSVVAVALPNLLEYVALEIAVPATGATLFPLPMGIGHRELRSVLQRSGAVLLITDGSPTGDGFADIAAAIDPSPAVMRAAELARAAPDASPRPRPAAVAADPDRIVQIALTSGTTGMPKLASLSARLKQLTFEGFTSRLRITAGDRMFPMSPITQGAGEMCLYALRCGAALVMTEHPRFEPERALAIVEQSRTTVLCGVPTMLARLLHSPGLQTRSLELVRMTISAGAPLPTSVARAWEQRTGSRVGSFYGAMDIGQLSVPDPEDPPEKRWTTVGRPHDRAEWRICGPDGSDLALGQAGGICMRGPLVQDRYWDDDTTPYSADGWAHFGDLGFVDDEGFLHITGRLKDTIIRGGNNINPLEVEEILREHPLVRDVCVVGRPDQDLGERAVAFVAPSHGHQLALEELMLYLGEQGLTRYKWPEWVELVENLPTGPTGKVDRKTLRARAAELNMEAARS
ncbi:MAG: acyl--CoA ligase [Acidobacteriota bacterium]|nr:acyl--CoA ligase [Acidobacteriota bacterium]